MPDMSSLQAALPYMLAAFLGGYALGAIPFGLILTRAAGLGDVRSIGSGNIGATNVLRTGNKGLAAATLLLDALKGTLAAYLGSSVSMEIGMLAALGALLGHLFPVWLGFKGGKGVATYLGILFGLIWQGGLIFCAVWLATAFISRFSSLAALLGCFTVPIVLYAMGSHQLGGFFALVSIIVIVKHRANIQRLVAGTEPKIGAK